MEMKRGRERWDLLRWWYQICLWIYYIWDDGYGDLWNARYEVKSDTVKKERKNTTLISLAGSAVSSWSLRISPLNLPNYPLLQNYGFCEFVRVVKNHPQISISQFWVSFLLFCIQLKSRTLGKILTINGQLYLCVSI